MMERTIMRKRDLRSIDRSFNKVLRRERLKNTAFGLLILWARGVFVILEILAILTGMYYFSNWMSSLTHKDQMRVIWGFVTGFFVLILPLLLGGFATVIGNVTSFLKRTIK